MLDVMELAIRSLFDHVSSGRFGILGVAKEIKLPAVVDEVVVVVERLVEKKGKKFFAQEVSATAVIADVDDQTDRLALLDLSEDVVKIVAQLFFLCSAIKPRTVRLAIFPPSMNFKLALSSGSLS